MNKLFAILLTLSCFSSFGQNWSGMTPGDIYYNSGKVGIDTSIPVEAFQIGDRWTFHNGGYKIIGYNFHYNGGDKRLVEKPASSISFTGDGDIFFRTALTGTAGSSISWKHSFMIKNDGRVGIGTSVPEHSLDILTPFTTGAESSLFIGQNHDFGANTGRYGIGLSLLHENSMVGGKTGFLNIWHGNTRTRVMIFTNTGNVGIGTINPGSFKLAVEGKIGAREIQVTAVTPWPDYVFEEGYSLADLSEVEKYVKEHKHLPGVPAATEVEEDGVNLGEMNVKLLEKVEELTLYMIELKKENEELKSRIEKLEEGNYE